MTSATDQSKFAWLQLITQENYDAASTKVDTAADIQFTELFKIGNAKGTYEQFRIKRDAFLQKNEGVMNMDQRIAYTRYIVPDDARTKYFECVARQVGLRVVFELETAKSATVAVHYRSEPGARQLYSINLVGGTLEEREPKLRRPIFHDGSDRFIVERSANEPEMRVVVRSRNNLSSSAVSVSPEKAVKKTQPCEARRLTPDRLEYLNANGIVRVNQAALTIAADCSAILSFTAAAMQVVQVLGNNGPHLMFALTGPNGFLTTLEQVQVVTVVQCGGYQQHTLQLPAARIPKEALTQATGFALNMPGGAAGTACNR